MDNCDGKHMNRKGYLKAFEAPLANLLEFAMQTHKVTSQLRSLCPPSLISIIPSLLLLFLDY